MTPAKERLLQAALDLNLSHDTLDVLMNGHRITQHRELLLEGETDLIKLNPYERTFAKEVLGI